jgi:thioredoxin 1
MLSRFFGKLVSRPAAAPLPSVASEADFIALVVAAEGPALVLFDAPESKAAARLRQALHLLGMRQPGLAIVSVDIAAMPELPQRYGVAGLPTLLLFRAGQIVARRLGESDAAELENWLDRKFANETAAMTTR